MPQPGPSPSQLPVFSPRRCKAVSGPSPHAVRSPQPALVPSHGTVPTPDILLVFLSILVSCPQARPQPPCTSVTHNHLFHVSSHSGPQRTASPKIRDPTSFADCPWHLRQAGVCAWPINICWMNPQLVPGLLPAPRPWCHLCPHSLGPGPQRGSSGSEGRQEQCRPGSRSEWAPQGTVQESRKRSVQG